MVTTGSEAVSKQILHSNICLFSSSSSSSAFCFPAAAEEVLEVLFLSSSLLVVGVGFGIEVEGWDSDLGMELNAECTDDDDDWLLLGIFELTFNYSEWKYYIIILYFYNFIYL